MTHRVSSRLEGRRTIVAASGELDAYAAPDLRAALRDAPPGAALVCDLSAVAFLDSTALGVVVGAFRRAREDGSPFAVVPPAGSARRIFELTSLDRVLPLAASADVEPDVIR